MDAFSRALLDWYEQERRVLPWREAPGPYRSWVSEVMLQQTRVDTVLPFFARFMARFPTVNALAQASEDEVLAHWKGLGYYARARNLHRGAQQVAAAGAFPTTVAQWRALPGVGAYMAAAIGSIALGLDEATVDGNIARVFSRVHADARPRDAMWDHARAHLPLGRAGDYNQALMDLGARICTPKKPLCADCPVQSHCQAHAAGTVERFPPPKPKRVVPSMTRVFGVWNGPEGTYMGRRPSRGLWGGLYEPPGFDVPDGSAPAAHLRACLSAEMGLELSACRPLGFLKHVLTHRVVHAHGFAIQAKGDGTPGPYTECRWVADPEALGISALTRRVLAWS